MTSDERELVRELMNANAQLADARAALDRLWRERGGLKPVSITKHPLWPLLKPLVRIEFYGPDGGPDDPRHRIEVVAPSDDAADLLCTLEMACVKCGRAIHPIRRRAGDHRRHLYYAATCPLDVCLPCSRGGEASAEYDRVRDAVLPERGLFA